jgi:hypothetical protein
VLKEELIGPKSIIGRLDESLKEGVDCPPPMSCAVIIPLGGGPQLKLEQKALQQLVKQASNGGKTPLTKQTVDTITAWAKEYKYPGFRASPADLAGAHGKAGPHIHVSGAGSHAIPIKP